MVFQLRAGGFQRKSWLIWLPILPRRAEVFASVCEIGGMILELLKDGYSVELDGLGDFYLSAGSEGFEDPKKCTPHRVKARRVCFRMAPCVRKSMKFVKFERNPW